MITIRRKVKNNEKSPLQRFEAFLDQAYLNKPKHQLEGLEWCASKEAIRSKGGIIGDEMGMGKTIIMLGLMVSVYKKHTLVILPKALINQWANEIQDKLHHKPYILYGAHKTKNLSRNILEDNHIILTTYGTCVYLGMDSELQKFKFGRIIIDEAHHLKSEKTKTYQVINNLQKDVLWLLTGTPIQNKIQDLFRLFDLLEIPRDDYKDIDKLPGILQKHMLRRKKSPSTIVLPDLKEYKCGVNWENERDAETSKIFHQRFSTMIASDPTTQGLYYGMNKNALVATLHAQMLCVSPYLLEHKMKRYYDLNDDEMPSDSEFNFFSSTTKLDAVVDKISNNHILEPSHKKLVFCHFRKEMDLLRDKMIIKTNLHCELYHGGLTSKQRSDLIEESPDVLILQIRSGCEGLNLQQYNEVYFVSPCWNPSIEAQALARCYRMGQKKETHVYRFYMKDFVEQNEEQGEQNEIPSMDSNIETRQEMKIKIVETMDSMCTQTISSGRD